MRSLKEVVAELKNSGFEESHYTTYLGIPRTTLIGLMNNETVIRETKNSSKILLAGSLMKDLVVKGYKNPITILAEEKIDGETVFNFIISEVRPKHVENIAIEKLLKNIFELKYPAKKEVSSIERFETKFNEKVTTETLLHALNHSPQYVCDIVNDSNISAPDRAEILELFSEVYTPELFDYVSSKVIDESPFIKSMAIETLIRYALDGHIDHGHVEKIVYPSIKTEESEDLKDHLSELYEYLETAS